MSVADKNSRINTLVLDAGPLITQSASQLQQYATNFYTTPGVFNELKDDYAKAQLLLWAENLKVRQPKTTAIKAVTDFAKLTGDFAVLSQNDLHIAALTYELECELNNGPWRLRTYPGEKKDFGGDKKVEKEAPKEGTKKEDDEWTMVSKSPTVIPSESQHTANYSQTETEDEEKVIDNEEQQTGTPESKKKPRRRGGKRHRKKPHQEQGEEQEQGEKEAPEPEEQESEQPEQEYAQIEEPEIIFVKINGEQNENELGSDYEDNEDDGEWITPDNLQEEMLKDSNEQIETSLAQLSKIKVALSTGDFAIQNISLQIGLNLMNSMSGLQIKRVRNYMYRCHACFTLAPIPKDGTPKHFCSSCGGSTLLRCAVSVNAKTGEIIPHLKKNFEWHKRGDKYSLPSPQSKNYAKKYGNQGFQHKGNSKLDQVFLREDQKEYQQAIKNAKWQIRKNEKTMQEFVGGGSADNFISPFFTGNDNVRPVQVNVGKGRFVNASRRKR